MNLIIGILIGQPVRQISSAAKDIAEGIAQGDFKRKIFLNSNDEMEDLSKTLNNMSEQIQNKVNELTTTKSRLEAVLLSMFEGVMVVDHDGYVLLINKTLRNLLGVIHEPFRRKPLEIIRNIEIQNLADKVLKSQSGVQSMELSVLLPEERILLAHATPIIREGKTEGAVLVFHDITQLRRLEHVRRDFVANVSHELRTPVSTIKGYAETLLEGALEDKANARDFVQIIYSDADRLAKLINELLDLSQIESGNMKFFFAPCSLRTMADRVLMALAKKLNEKSIAVKNQIPSAFPSVRADETGITQVFFNLIENAIKYNKDHGSITISAHDLGKYIEVKVTDTGIGIPEEDLPRIFERFYRVDKAHSRQSGGTGLGLSIVKHMIQVHQGEVSVESALGQGSTFSFTLPKSS